MLMILLWRWGIKIRMPKWSLAKSVICVRSESIEKWKFHRKNQAKPNKYIDDSICLLLPIPIVVSKISVWIGFCGRLRVCVLTHAISRACVCVCVWQQHIGKPWKSVLCVYVVNHWDWQWVWVCVWERGRGKRERLNEIKQSVSCECLDVLFDFKASSLRKYPFKKKQTKC